MLFRPDDVRSPLRAFRETCSTLGFISLRSRVFWYWRYALLPSEAGMRGRASSQAEGPKHGPGRTAHRDAQQDRKAVFLNMQADANEGGCPAAGRAVRVGASRRLLIKGRLAVRQSVRRGAAASAPVGSPNGLNESAAGVAEGAASPTAVRAKRTPAWALGLTP